MLGNMHVFMAVLGTISVLWISCRIPEPQMG